MTSHRDPGRGNGGLPAVPMTPSASVVCADRDGSASAALPEKRTDHSSWSVVDGGRTGPPRSGWLPESGCRLGFIG
jgi:hypothetical protein